MIKELLISLAVAAASGVSSFVGSPKRVISNSHEPYGEYSFTFTYYSHEDELYANIETPLGNLNESQLALNQDYQYYIPSGSNNLEVNFNLYDDNTASVSLYWYFDNLTRATNFYNNAIANFSFDYESPANVEETLLDDTDNYVEIAFDIPQWQTDLIFSFTLTDPNPATTQTLTKTFVNCDIASSPRLPGVYSSDEQLTYYVLMVAAAGGYGFTAQSVTQTGGITIRNFNLFDQYNNSGYYAACSFNIDLPLNDCSLNVSATLPTYTITSTLNRCTVSPSLPASYSGTSFSGDYTFTAISGYGFNKNYNHVEVTNLFVDSVEFTSLLWGSFYSSITLHLRASGGNSTIIVTAIEYDEENYKLGYDEGRADGWQAGYDRGHADGEIAGDSYGVWNWLKQAAITTGEFLNIPLLPGFSLGGLLTALAGLVIIWFFIRGFLFKS